MKQKPWYVMTVGQLREVLAEVPDDAALFADEGDEADTGRFVEVSLGYIFPETDTQDVAVVLALGQNWEIEYELQDRLNTYIEWDEENVAPRSAVDVFLQARFSEERIGIRDIEKALDFFQEHEKPEVFAAIRMGYVLKYKDHPDFRREWFGDPDA